MPLEEACSSLASYIYMSISSSVRILLLCRLTYSIYLPGTIKKTWSAKPRKPTINTSWTKGTGIASQQCYFSLLFRPTTKGGRKYLRIYSLVLPRKYFYLQTCMYRNMQGAKRDTSQSGDCKRLVIPAQTLVRYIKNLALSQRHPAQSHSSSVHITPLDVITRNLQHHHDQIFG